MKTAVGINKIRRLSATLGIQLILVFTFYLNPVRSQIILEYGSDVTAEDMVEMVLGDGIVYSNVSSGGSVNGAGVFTGGSTTNLGIEAGIFLTSGHADGIPGANTGFSSSWNCGYPGDASLNNIATGSTWDAWVLEFDFIPESDTLRMKYVFGSEEYNEEVGYNNDDICGIFISGPDPSGGSYEDKNIAIVPGTINTPVSINTVNNGWAPGGVVPTGPCTNCQYFNDNTGGLTIKYDAFTTVLVAWILVDPCAEYHLKIAVADVDDMNVDSGIFIEADCIGPPVIDMELIPFPSGFPWMVEGHVEGDLFFSLPSASYSPLTVNFEVTGTANPAAYPDGDFYEEIPTLVFFEEGSDSTSFHIIPVYDMIVEGEETLELIVENTLGCTTRHDTVILPVQDYIDMETTMSPNTMICTGQQIELSVQVVEGFPPYTYSWEPGGQTTSAITVAPEETTMYYVYCQDVFMMDTVVDSVLVTVFPNDGAFNAFSFEKALNPQLPFDINGELFEDSVSVIVPEGIDLSSLIATFTLSGTTLYAQVGNQPQFSGLTPNDFSDPVVYGLISAAGCARDWTVAVGMATGIGHTDQEMITILPNPASHKLFIEHATGSEIQLINGEGIEVLRTEITHSPCELDVRHLSEGIYFLRIKRKNKETTRKIILAR